MKVAMVSDWFSPRIGGLETVVYELSSELASRDNVEVEVITENYPKTFTFHNKVQEMNGFTVRRLSGFIFPDSLENVYFHPELPFKLKELFKEQDYDVVHVHPLFTPLAAISLSIAKEMHPPRKCVIRSNNSVREEVEGSMSKLLYKFMTLPTDVDRVLVPTERSTEFERKNGVDPENIEVVPLGTNIDRYNPKKYSEELRQKLEIGSSIFLLFVGRLFKRKGLEYLVKAVGKSAKEVDINLVIVGKGPLKRELEKLSEGLGVQNSVKFIGERPEPELQKLYASCDFVAAPSIRGEAFGLVIPEAMASGKPIIAGDIAAYSEVFVEGTGYLVPPKNVEDLKDKIIKLSKDESLRRKMGKKGRKKVIKRYSWGKTADRILRVYNETLSKV